MRFLAVAVTAAALVLPASGAGVDARLLVLRETEVPARYLLDETNSVRLTRAQLEGSSDESARALLRFGFLNGYYARYLNSDPPHWRYVTSAAFVFRGTKGARSYLPWAARAGFVQLGGRPSRIRLGDEGLVYSSGSADTGTAVLWRHGRVVAFVTCSEMTRHRALALAQARKQQRIIVAVVG